MHSASIIQEIPEEGPMNYLPDEVVVGFVPPYLTDKQDMGSILQVSRNCLRLFNSKEAWTNKIKHEFNISCVFATPPVSVNTG